MDETKAATDGAGHGAGLAAGIRLGSYIVRDQIGQGGMGIVWRATDTSLGRDVALKVLPAEFTRDPDRLPRFEREAKLLAALNHPNIAQIYGLQASGAVQALVMELVEGPTLAERMGRGALPLEEGLTIARQVAEALEEAHDKGIVHRDLKPQNIKVTATGRVKVLDFGLAKALDPGGQVASVSLMSASPTLSGTLQGTILGTAAYMAPEQAAGLAVDRRADIWAFGVVLYEMLTGRRLFEGETVTHVLAAVMKDEPDFEALPPETPPAIRDLIRRCLRRKPRERLQAIGDARLAIEEAGDPGRTATLAEHAPSTRSRSSMVRGALPWAVLAALTIAGAIALLRPRGQEPSSAPAPSTRFTLLPQERGEIDGFPAISPDGRSLIYGLADESGTTRLWAHSFDTGESRLLPGTENAVDPFWSPDGRWIGFFSRGWLRKLEMTTGLIQGLAVASDPRGGGWSDSGDLYFTPNSSSGLYKVSTGGGKVVQVLTLDLSRDGSYRFPVPLPGGRSLIFTAILARKGGQVRWLPLGGGESKVLLSDISKAAYDPRGYLLWVRQGSLVAQRFDPDSGVLSGNPFPIAPGVGVDGQKTARSYFGTGGGTIAFRVGLDWMSQLKWYDRTGQVLGEVTSPGYFDEMSISPDGNRVVVTKNNPANEPDTWVYDTRGMDQGARTTFDGSFFPIWGPNRVCYTRPQAGGWGLACRPADGGGAEEMLALRPSSSAQFSGASLHKPLFVFEEFNEQGGQDLWLLSLKGDRTPRPVLQSPAAEGHGAFSPDDRLLAYSSDETGLPQIFVQEIEGGHNRWQVTTEGADQASWRADGRELYYVGLDRTLHAVPVKNLVPFAVGLSTKLFPIKIPLLAISGTRTVYGPAPDGQRFLVNTRIGEGSEPGFRIILNWSPAE
jgi:serine/threonine protein kinase